MLLTSSVPSGSPGLPASEIKSVPPVGPARANYCPCSFPCWTALRRPVRAPRMSRRSGPGRTLSVPQPAAPGRALALLARDCRTRTPRRIAALEPWGRPVASQGSATPSLGTRSLRTPYMPQTERLPQPWLSAHRRPPRLRIRPRTAGALARAHRMPDAPPPLRAGRLGCSPGANGQVAHGRPGALGYPRPPRRWPRD